MGLLSPGRDDLHAVALQYGPTWLELAARTDVCPTTFGGREFELWQPILALAAWLDESGADGLLTVVTEYAKRAIDAGRDDTMSEADEALLRILAGHVQAGTQTTLRAGQILLAACETDPATFGGVTMFLAGIAILASYVPARKASLIEPTVALRAD